MDKKAIAYYNNGILDTIFIYDILYDIDNFVLYKHIRQKRPYKSKIRYDRQGNAYFITYGSKYYLSEFLRLEGQEN